jgi:vitamin B12 transporter
MRRLPLISIIAVAALAGDALGQSDTSRLAPVVITASRTSTEQAVATTAATVLSGDALRARGISTVGAALREVPGVAIVQTSAPGSQTSLFLRGGEPDYVQVLIDGVVMNEPGGTFNFANLSVDNVERIEIIRGPASVLYGSDAVTGVIQIFTRQGGGGLHADVGVRGGQRGLLDVDAGVAGGGPRARYSLGGGHHASAGIYDLNNDARNGDASGRLTIAPTSRSTVSLTGLYADARYDFPTEYYGAPLDPDSYTTERRLAAGLDGIYAVHPRADVRVMLGLSRLQNISDDLPDNPDDFGFRFESRSLRRSAEARVDLRLIPSSTLTVGGDFDWQENETNGDAPSAIPLLERWSRAAYGQLLGDVMRRWTYTVGGRLEQNERFGTHGSARGGLGLALGPTTSIRASGGTAYKEPQFPEITGGCCAVANEDLGPERSTSVELGIEQRLLGDALALSLTRFDQRFRDLIIYAPDPENEDDDPATPTIYHYENARTAVARGWELEARAAGPGGTSARANFSMLDATMRRSATEPEKPLPRRPSRTGALVVAAPFGARLTLVGDANYVGPRHDVRFFPGPPFSLAERLSSYTVIGMSATFHAGRLLGASGVELSARVDNLLDDTYQAVAGFESPGRIASIGARLRYGR